MTSCHGGHIEMNIKAIRLIEKASFRFDPLATYPLYLPTLVNFLQEAEGMVVDRPTQLVCICFFVVAG